MKKLLLLLAVTLAFTFTALAQDATPAGGATGQTTTTTKTKTKKAKKAAGDEQAAATEGAKPKKEASVTGCISAQPDANGMYTLSNGRYKKGVEIGPTDKVKEHAGHQVQLKGEWAKAEAASGGATKAAAKSKSFEVSDVKHLSDTCSEAPGGATTGATKKGEKEMKKGKAKGEAATPPPGF